MSLIGAMVQPLAVGNRSPLSDYWYQPVGQPSLSGALINSTTAMKVSAVWGCVRLLGEIIASLPLVTYERVSEDERRKAEDNAIYWVLHDDPNPWQTHLEWVEMQTTQVLLRGNGYSEIKPGPEGPVGQLVPLSPDRMQVDWLSSGGYRYRYREPSGAERPINGEDIFHLRGLSLDGITGVSVIEYARESMGLAIASEGYAARFFGGDATPGGVLEHPGRLSPAAHDQLKKSWKQTHSGYQKAHEMAILEEGMKWHQMSLSAADSQLLESRSFQVTDVARWFRVPLHMIGSLEKETAWGTGIENLSLGFVIYTLLPWLRRWESALSRSLIVDRRRYYPEFVVAGLLRGDQKSRYDAYAVARQWGWLSVNDIRRLENMTPVEGGDAYLSPLNMTQVGQKTPEPVPSLPRPARESAHYQFLLHDAAARVIRREIAALSKAAKRCASDTDGWRAAVEEFYVDHAEFVRQTLRVGGRVAVDYVEQQKAMLLRFGAAAMEDWEPRRVLDLVSLALGEHDAAGAAREV